MKKFFYTMVALLMMAVSSQAMSYEQARQQALFLADKMAYELNLTEDQYEACYEVNLDYLMGVTGQADLYGDYWTRRNLDLSYILYDWQYRAFVEAAYFYRPLYWADGFWHFGIYARYPHRHYFYFGRPAFWTVYRGGHAWHNNGGHSWYHGRQFGHNHGGHVDRNRHNGMRDGFNKGNYGRGQDFSKNRDNGRRDHGVGQSSTRTTVTNRGGHTMRDGNKTVERPSVVRRSEGMTGERVDRGTTVRRSTEATRTTVRPSVESRTSTVTRPSTVTRSTTVTRPSVSAERSSSVSRSVSPSRSAGSMSTSRSSSSMSSHGSMSGGSRSMGGSSHAGGGSRGGRR